MKLERCKLGHFYDSEQYDKCPYCDSADVEQSPVEEHHGLRRCEEGHFYESDRFDMCPYCNPGIPDKAPVARCRNGHVYNKKQYKHCPYCPVEPVSDDYLYVGDYLYKSTDKKIYIGVGKLGCICSQKLEAYVNPDAYFLYCDYDTTTFMMINDNFVLLPKPQYLDFTGMADDELFRIDKLYRSHTLNDIDDSVYGIYKEFFEILFNSPYRKEIDFCIEHMSISHNGKSCRLCDLTPIYQYGAVDIIFVVSASNPDDMNLAMMLSRSLGSPHVTGGGISHSLFILLSAEYNEHLVFQTSNSKDSRVIRESILKYELNTWFCSGDYDAYYLFVLPYRTIDELINILKPDLAILKSINTAQNYFDSISPAISGNIIKDDKDIFHEILDRVKNLEGITGDIHDDIKNLTSFVESVTRTVSDNRLQYQQRIGLSPLSDDQIDTARDQFIHETANEITARIFSNTNTIQTVQVVENELKGLFGLFWDQLDSYTRKSLISAEVFLRSCQETSNDTLDYSGVVIAATSALENELKIIFFDGYKDFLRQKYGNDFSRWPSSMKYPRNNSGRCENQRFSLGDMPFILGADYRKDTPENTNRYKGTTLEPNETQDMNQYLVKLTGDNKLQIQAFLEKSNGENIIDRCEDIRCMYRNAAAHTESLTLGMATACCRDIIGVDINDASQKVGQIQGLLYDIAKLTRASSLD